MQIEVSFRTWQQLTAQLRDENDSYDAVIVRLLGAISAQIRGVSDVESNADDSSRIGAVYKGVFLPSGTMLRATYKGKTFYGEIRGSDWVDVETGDRRTSPSQAAYSITHGGVNGWLFWLVKRPGDSDWQTLNDLRTNR